MEKTTKIPLRSISFVLMLILISTFSCKEEHDPSQEEALLTSNIPVFKSNDDLFDLQKILMSFTFDQLKSWEDSHGYKSFGRICEELYFSVKPTDFKSIEEVQEFVRKNSEYLVLIEGKDGKLTLEVVDHSNPFRYLINREKCFQVGDTIFRIIDDYIASTDFENITELVSLEKADLSTCSNKLLKLYKFRNFEEANDRLKDAQYYASYGDDDHTDNGDDRTHIELYIYMWDDAGITKIRSHYLVRAYHYTWPIWYWSQAVLVADVRVAEDYYVSPSWRRFTEYSGIIGGQNVYSMEADIGHTTVSQPAVTHEYHFGGYYFWADSDKTGDVGLAWNNELVPDL